MVEYKVAVYADYPLRFIYYRSLSDSIPCSSARTHASDASAGETLFLVTPMGLCYTQLKRAAPPRALRGDARGHSTSFDKMIRLTEMRLETEATAT